MAYELGEIKLSQQIFYYLLQHHELKEDTEHRLYRAYTQEVLYHNISYFQKNTRGNNTFYSQKTQGIFPLHMIFLPPLQETEMKHQKILYGMMLFFYPSG